MSLIALFFSVDVMWGSIDMISRKWHITIDIYWLRIGVRSHIFLLNEPYMKVSKETKLPTIGMKLLNALTNCFIPAQPLTLFFCILFADRCRVFSEAHHKNNFFLPTRMHRTRRTQTLLLPRGAQIEIEYNPRRPSIRTIVRQVEALGYTVLVRPFQGRQEKILKVSHLNA